MGCRIFLPLRTLIVSAIFVVPGCNRKPQTAKSGPPESPAVSNEHSPDERVFILKLSVDELRELQQAVLSEGHQPWRLEPLEVAHAELLGLFADRRSGLNSSIERRDIERDDAWVIRRTGNTAAAKWTGTASTVLLNLRLDGIWFTDRAVVKWKGK